jgi:colicin import membrane protein
MPWLSPQLGALAAAESQIGMALAGARAELESLRQTRASDAELHIAELKVAALEQQVNEAHRARSDYQSRFENEVRGWAEQLKWGNDEFERSIRDWARDAAAVVGQQARVDAQRVAEKVRREVERQRREMDRDRRDAERQRERDLRQIERDREQAKRDAEQAKRDAERAQRDAERARRDEQLKRDAERQKSIN